MLLVEIGDSGKLPGKLRNPPSHQIRILLRSDCGGKRHAVLLAPAHEALEGPAEPMILASEDRPEQSDRSPPPGPFLCTSIIRHRASCPEKSSIVPQTDEEPDSFYETTERTSERTARLPHHFPQYSEELSAAEAKPKQRRDKQPEECECEKGKHRPTEITKELGQNLRTVSGRKARQSVGKLSWRLRQGARDRRGSERSLCRRRNSREEGDDPREEALERRSRDKRRAQGEEQ